MCEVINIREREHIDVISTVLHSAKEIVLCGGLFFVFYILSVKNYLVLLLWM